MSRSPNAVVGLYRTILRLHRSRLPAMERTLGDQYVKSEFRLHKDAKPEFVDNFVVEWTKYATMLEGVPAGGKVGADLDPVAVEEMTDEQRMQLHNLKQSTRELEGELWSEEFAPLSKA
jgi:hypothetical protein